MRVAVFRGFKLEGTRGEDSGVKGREDEAGEKQKEKCNWGDRSILDGGSVAVLLHPPVRISG